VEETVYLQQVRVLVLASPDKPIPEEEVEPLDSREEEAEDLVLLLFDMKLRQTNQV
jgi:hypothetical protein